MAYVYRYTDLSDNIIKYVGIVWSDNMELKNRIDAHHRDDWYAGTFWKIEYLSENIVTRTDAEYFEAHYISLYGTDKYHNKMKAGWGISHFLPDRENEWKEYVDPYIPQITYNMALNKTVGKDLIGQLLKNGTTIIRVLDFNTNMVLYIDCIKKNMPTWGDISLLNDFEPCSQEELINRSSCQLRKIESLNERDKDIMRKRYKMISQVMPYLKNEKLRSNVIEYVSEQNNVCKQTLRNYLCMFLTYNDIISLAPVDRYQNTRGLTDHEKNMKMALERYHICGSESIMGSYLKMIEDHYTDCMGNFKSCPTFNQFRYFYRKIKDNYTVNAAI